MSQPRFGDIVVFNPVRALARPLLASTFVMGGLDQLQHPEGKVDAADDVAPDVAERVGLGGLETRTLVQVNGAAQVLGGIALGLGKLPRLASAVLAASLVPTTVAGHRFWEEKDPQARAGQQIHFFKNASMLGGLLMTALDRQGRLSVPQKASHEADLLKQRAAHEADHLRTKAKLTKERAIPDVQDAKDLVDALR